MDPGILDPLGHDLYPGQVMGRVSWESQPRAVLLKDIPTAAQGRDPGLGFRLIGVLGFKSRLIFT